MSRERERHLNILPADSSATIPDMREYQHHHTAYADVQHIYDYIRNGDVEHMRNLGQEFQSAPFSVGRMSEDDLMEAKYIASTTASVANYIGIQSGLPDEYSYSLVDVFIREIDQLTDPDEIYDRLYQYLIHYTELMQSLEYRTANPYILKCLHFIHVNLNHHITPDALADLCGLSRSRLFVLFKRETGCTISEYVQAERLKESHYMLTSGRYESISQIAFLLNFCSQSYFSACFREMYGYTPGTIFVRKK